MPTAQWQPETGVITRLLAQPQQFQFFQAMHLLETWLGPEGLEQFLRFRNTTSAAFPPSEIERLTLTGPERLEMTPSFFSYLGAHGVLPNHYSEVEGLAALLDGFLSRAMLLFYRAWSRYRIEHGVDIDKIQSAIAGVEPSSAHRASHWCAALLRERASSAEAIGRVLTAYFDLPIKLEQFVGGWDDLHEHELTILGKQNCVLGQDAVLGSREWRCDQRVRICIGPLTRAQFQSFVPGTDAARELAVLVAHFATSALKFEVQLILRAADVDGARLSGNGNGACLGQGSFLSSQVSDCDRVGLEYALDLPA